MALLLASGFVMAAAQRYPGLLKEPQQGSAYKHLILGGKVLSFLTAATLAVGAARWLVLSRLKKRAKP